MPRAPGDPTASPALTELPEPMRQRALERYHKLRPHLELNLPLAGVAQETSVPFRTAQRWVSRYRRFALAGLAALDEPIGANGDAYRMSCAISRKVWYCNDLRSARALYTRRCTASPTLGASDHLVITPSAMPFGPSPAI